MNNDSQFVGIDRAIEEGETTIVVRTEETWHPDGTKIVRRTVERNGQIMEQSSWREPAQY